MTSTRSFARGGLVAILALACSDSGPRTMAIPSVTARVLDAETGRPLPGIEVLYAVQTVVRREWILGCIPSLEPDIGPRLAVQDRGRTDERGEVTFSPRALELPSQRFDGISLFVNVEVDLSHPLSRVNLELAADACKQGRPTCGEPATDVTVAWRIAVDRVSRRDVLRPADRHYRPAHVLLVAETLFPHLRDADDEDLATEFHPSRFGEKEVIRVELRPYRSQLSE